jgi:hypothetical protein
MQLQPELRTPYAPRIRAEGSLSPDQMEFRDLIQNSLDEMSRHCRHLISAIALFDFCRSQPTLENFSSDWSFVAARDGAMSLRNFAHSIFQVRGAIGKIPNWLERVDVGKLKKAHQKFEVEFPFAHKLRHAVAHPEFYADPKKEMGTRDAINIKGIMVAEGGGSITINQGLFNNKFTCTFEGEIIEYELSLETCKIMLEICQESFECFNKVAQV